MRGGERKPGYRWSTISRGVLYLATGSFLAGCGPNDGRHPPLSDRGAQEMGGAGNGYTGDPCATPQLDCPCAEPGRVVSCGAVKRQVGLTIYCSNGERKCRDDSTWGQCEGDEITELSVPVVEKRTQALGDSSYCSNYCDPYCLYFLDAGSGIGEPPVGILSSEDGLSIEESEDVPPDTPTCDGMTISPKEPTIIVTELNRPSASGGGGLVGEYFPLDGENVSGSIPNDWTDKKTRVDTTIDFGWGTDAPAFSGFPQDNFTVRWSGELIADETTDFQLHTVADDGVRVWLGGVLIIDNWVLQAPTEIISNPLPLTKDTHYPIVVEYFEKTGGATARLYWSTSSRSRTIIPSSALDPGFGDTVPFSTEPENIQFTAELSPSDCYDGVASPAWSLERFDSATLDESGLFSVFSGVAGPVDVGAYLGDFFDGTTVDVLVDVLETDLAPSGAVESFEEDVHSADSLTFLYPYADTVFPLGVAPPLVQYDDGGSSASAVKLTLRYPSDGDPVFEWATIVSESSPPRVTIPEYAWNAFERTAKTNEASIVLQRIVDNTLKGEVARTIRFAEAPLRGKIYYTQYARNGGTRLMIADPGSSDPAYDAFGTSNGCPVCHSVSANGRALVTSDRGWSSQGGVSEILDSGLLNSLADHPGDSQYRQDADDWRGFAWAPLTPNGTFALTANNIWGNSVQSVVGIDTSSDTVSVPELVLSGGNGTGLLAEYYSNNDWTGTRWAKLVPYVDYDFDGDGPGGPIGSDFTARFSGQLSPYFSEDTTFTAISTGGVQLRIDGQVVIDDLSYSGASRVISGVTALEQGVQVPIELLWRDTGGDALLSLHWSGALTPNSRIPTTQLFVGGAERGVVVEHHDNTTFSSLVASKLKPEVYADWGGQSPLGLGDDNFSTVWRGRIEAPLTGSIDLCVDSDDGVSVAFDGSTVISGAGVTDSCSSPLFLNEGSLYDLEVRHREDGGDAHIELSWQASSFSRTRVSGAYLYPPSSFSTPENGLEASYYDHNDYSNGQGVNPTLVGTGKSYVENIDEDWGTGRPDYTILSSSDSFSVRYVGLIEAPCSGIYEFSSIGDDTWSMWIGEHRVAYRPNWGSAKGAVYLEAGQHEFKYEVAENSGGAQARLEWIPRCTGATQYSTVPSSAFFIGGAGAAGFVRAGGDNGSRVDYWVWDLPPGSGMTPRDATADSAGAWGLGNTTMMVPSFAPNGSALVFVDGDQGGGSGWRKGLSVFDFNESAKLFSHRRLILNHWPYGDVIKWPVFEADSRSVIYQTSTPVDWCCKGGWTQYGHMAPTNYFEIPGRLWSIDTEADAPQPVELLVANRGERPDDANKAYQPTVLPAAAGGYRWVVFTSTRPYGNTFNGPEDQNDYSNTDSYSPMVINNQLQSMLWIAAIEDEPSGDTDRSYPAFLLPNQNYNNDPANGYLNERGYWALDECRPIGDGPGSECEVDEDCCGGSGEDLTARCRVDVPVGSPPVRHCQEIPSISSCQPDGESCTESSECCLGGVCVSAVCSRPPPIARLNPVNFTRDFEAECPNHATATWGFFDFKAQTPSDSYIEFFAQSVDDPSEFKELPVAPDAVISTQVVGVAVAAGPQPSGWVGNAVGELLDEADLKSRRYLRITMRFAASSDDQYTPTLSEWRQTYSCPPDE